MSTKIFNTCNVCGDSHCNLLLMRKLNSRLGHGVAEVFRCSSCGTGFLGALAATFDDDLYSYYERYRKLNRAQIYPDLTRSRYVSLLERLQGRVPGREFIDVGCGLGGFVEAALVQGWTGCGIDLAGEAVDIGIDHGLPLQKMDFFSPQIAPASKDLITMFEFIEHVPKPGDFLTRAEEILRPGGILYLTTPNYNSIDRLILKEDWEAIHVEHLSYFTPHTLTQLLARSTTLQTIDLTTKNISADLAAKLLPARNRSVFNEFAHSEKQSVRHTVERSRPLRTAKGVLNLALNISRLGSAMTVILEKPGLSPRRGGSSK